MTGLVEKLGKVFLAVSASIFLGIVLINVANLLWRWILGQSLAWILEISLILIVYSVLFCVPVLYAKKGLIQMSLIQGLVKERGMIYVNIFVEMAILAFLVYMIPKSLSLSLKQMHTMSRGLGIPRIFVTLPVFIAMTMCLLVNINNQTLLFREYFSKPKAKKGQGETRAGS